ncbi:MAG: ABC transporter ATP-binding protein [Sedimentisphaerales bacterium]|jgi:cobalt/nickel transport system ATP-binding protein
MTQAIQIDNFSYKYPDGTTALSGITLTIEHGRRVALIGPNGAGKSTLLLAMTGFIRGTGKVIIDGLEITNGNLKQVRSRIGCCFENPEDQLFMPTLFDDVAFGPLNMGLPAGQVKQRVALALQKVGLAKMAERAPHHLSAGQKRSAAIATVLSMSPKIITLDEPDGNLDPRNRNNLVKLLAGLSQTLVIATCSMDFAAAVADMVVLMDGGCMVAVGPAERIMSDSKLMTDHGLETPRKFAAP